MKKVISSFMTLVLLFSLCTVGLVQTSTFKADAADNSYTEGNYTYSVNNGTAEIIGFDDENNNEENLVIPATLGGLPVTKIAVAAFRSCNSIKSIEIAGNIQEVGAGAFLECKALENVFISSGVTILGVGVFPFCSRLSRITVSDDNPNFSNDEHGVLFNKDKSELLQYPGGKVEKTYFVPEGVTIIGRAAFAGSVSLSEISIPNTVSTVDLMAFYYCDRLKKITFLADSDDNHILKKICNLAFMCCSSLTDITLSDGIAIIGENAFASCTSLENITIPESVTSIGRGTFSCCTSLVNITIPAGLIDIGAGGFELCRSLEKICVSKDNKYYSSDANGVLFNKNKTELIQYPIGDTKTSYTIPDSVTKIGDYAFNNSRLVDISIPNSVTSIGNRAFDNCLNLKSITIPDSVTSIGTGAFWNCISLENITIPESVTSIGIYAFHCYRSLANITVDLNNKNYSSDEYGVLFNKDKTELIQYPAGNTRTSYTVPDSVTSVGSSAFENCSNLVNITLPAGITNIGESAFRDSGISLNEANWENGIFYIGEYLISGTASENVEIREGTRLIASYAFCDHNLINVVIPDTVKYICEGAFYNCDKLCNISLGNNVVQIDDRAFYGCHEIENVNIPANVSHIGARAFESVKCFDVNEENAFYSSDSEGSLYSKNKTVLIQCSKSINDTYTMSNSVTTVISSAFEKIDFAINIPKSVTAIENPDDRLTCLWAKNISEVYYEGSLKEYYQIENIDSIFPNATIYSILDNTNSKSMYPTEEEPVVLEWQPWCFTDDTAHTEYSKISENFSCGGIYISNANEIYKQYALYQIGVVNKDGELVQPNEGYEVTVKILLPEDFDTSEKLTVIHWFGSGGREIIEDAQIKNNILIFKTGSFSKFEIVSYDGYNASLAPTVSIKNNPGSATINYGETLNLTAVTTNMPADAKIVWFVDGVKKGEGTTFNITPESGSVNVTVKIVDKDGNESYGTSVSDSQAVTVKSGFFQKLISFFKNLFGLNRVIVQSLNLK